MKKITDEFLKHRLDYFVWTWTEDESYRMRGYANPEEEAQLYADEDKMFEDFDKIIETLSSEELYDLFVRSYNHLEMREKEGVIPIGIATRNLRDVMHKKQYSFTPKQRAIIIKMLLELKWLAHDDTSTMDDVHAMLADFFGIKLGYSQYTDHPNKFLNESKDDFINRNYELINSALLEKNEEPILN